MQVVVSGERGQSVSLRVDDVQKTVSVGGDGALAWVMRDLQAMYRGIATAVELLTTSEIAPSYIGNSPL